MRRQLEAMEGQLAAMNEAGAQTERLIEHAEKSAEAALLNAQAVINAERPWIALEVGRSTERRQAISATIWIMRNCGRTPARLIKVTSKRGIEGNDPSHQIDLDEEGLVGPQERRELSEIWPSEQFSKEQLERFYEGEFCVWYELRVEYSDPFKPNLTHVSEFMHYLGAPKAKRIPPDYGNYT